MGYSNNLLPVPGFNNILTLEPTLNGFSCIGQGFLARQALRVATRQCWNACDNKAIFTRFKDDMESHNVIMDA